MQTVSDKWVYLMKLHFWLFINLSVSLFLFINPNMDFIFMSLIALLSRDIFLPRPKEKVGLNKKVSSKELWQVVALVCVLIAVAYVWELFKPHVVLGTEIFVKALATIILVTTSIFYIKYVRSQKYNKPLKRDK